MHKFVNKLGHHHLESISTNIASTSEIEVETKSSPSYRLQFQIHSLFRKLLYLNFTEICPKGPINN